MRYYSQITNWQKELLQYPFIFFFGGLFQVAIIERNFFHDGGLNWQDTLVTGAFWVVMWKGSEYMVRLMDKTDIKWTEEPVKRFVLTVFVTVAYVVFAVLFLYTLIFSVFGNIPFLELMGDLSWGNFKFSIIITLSLGTILHGRAFLLEWREAAVEMEKFKSESIKSQYESLKNQVNPHFLFNSLNALSSLVYDDQDKAVDFIRKLSQVYRYVLDNKDMELVSIQDELQFLNNYLFLQKIRFGDNLILKVIDQNKTGLIPPLGLQLLVENAIKHNIVSEQRPLTITVYLGEDFYSVSNNIQEKLSKDSTGIGLNNLKSRYDFLTDERVTIWNENNIFEVRLPIITIDKSNKDK